jgi:phage terminase Nu1 subunit (DNA packaging protein)
MAQKKKGASVKAMADHVDCTTESLRQYVSKKITKPLADGSYDLDKTRVDVIRYLRNKASGRRTADGDDLSVERARLAREQTIAAKLKNAVAAGQFVPVQVIESVFETSNLVVREQMLSLPSIAGEIHAMVRPSISDISEVIRKNVYEALTELADPKFFQKRGDEIDSTRATEAT